MRVLKARWAAIPLLLLVMAAIFRPDLVLDAGWFIRGWAIVALVAFGIVLFPLFSSDDVSNLYLGMLAHAFVYLLCLFGTWVAGVTGGSQIAGMFPILDASEYFQDAIFLLAGKDFTSFSARRPLFAGVLAAGLGWTDLNLKLVLMCFAVTVSVAAFLFSKQVARDFGPVAGSLTLLLMFLFYRRFLGTLLTENLGLSFGLLGTTLLLQSLSMEKYRLTLASYGLFVLTIALLARAGAFLILPAIVFYFWQMDWKTLMPSYRTKWLPVVTSVGAIGVAFGCNLLVRNVTGSAENVPMGNGAYGFYGMAAGYKGWYQIFIDHPELKDISEPLVIYRTIDATVALIRDQPMQLVKAVVFSFGDFFLRIFGFAKLNFVFQDARAHLIVNLIVVSLLNVCLFSGLLYLWRRRVNIRVAPFLLCAFAGIVLSAPFAPPIDSDSMRAYAATFPIVALVTAFGITALSGVNQRFGNPGKHSCRGTVICLSAGLVLVAIVGPWVVRGNLDGGFFQTQKVCLASEKSYFFQTHPALAVDLVEKSDKAVVDLYPSTRVNLEAFRKNLAYNQELSNSGQLNNILAGNTMFVGRDLSDDSVRLFLAGTPEVQNKKGILNGCGEYLDADHSNRGSFALVKIHSVEELSVP